MESMLATVYVASDFKPTREELLMYRITIALAIIMGLVSALGMAQVDDNDLKTEKDKVSYVVGLDVGRTLQYGKDLLDLEVLLRGIKDKLDGAPPLVSGEDFESMLQSFQGASLTNQRKIETASESKILQAKGEEEGVVSLASGLRYKILQEGSGRNPVDHDQVRAHYEGRLLSGKVFDSSYEKGVPLVIPVNRVIPGWSEALQLMNVGSKWELYIPFKLAYGEKGAPPVIPPFSTLVFQVELLEILDHGHAH
jgi:FKBP-type peptidyl-prolyl cis-trans isomerase